MRPAPIRVTGAAGFIGFHVCRALLNQGQPVVGIDNLNTYYDPTLKTARIKELRHYANFHFERLDLSDRPATEQIFIYHRPQSVIHLAAQPEGPLVRLNLCATTERHHNAPVMMWIQIHTVRQLSLTLIWTR